MAHVFIGIYCLRLTTQCHLTDSIIEVTIFGLFEDLIKLKAGCSVMSFTSAFENDLRQSLTLVVGRQKLTRPF